LKPNAFLRKAICLDFLFNLLFFFSMFCIGKISELHVQEDLSESHLPLFGYCLFIARFLLLYALVVGVTRHICLGESEWRFYKNLTRSYFWRRLVTFLLQLTFYAACIWLPLNFLLKGELLALIGIILFVPLLVLQSYLLGRLTFLPYQATCKKGESLRETLSLAKGTVLRTLMLKWASLKIVNIFLGIIFFSIELMSYTFLEQYLYALWKSKVIIIVFSLFSSLFLTLYLAYFAALAHYYQSTYVIKRTFKPAPRTEFPPVPQPLADAISASTS